MIGHALYAVASKIAPDDVTDWEGHVHRAKSYALVGIVALTATMVLPTLNTL